MDYTTYRFTTSHGWGRRISLRNDEEALEVAQEMADRFSVGHVDVHVRDEALNMDRYVGRRELAGAKR